MRSTRKRAKKYWESPDLLVDYPEAAPHVEEDKHEEEHVLVPDETLPVPEPIEPIEPPSHALPAPAAPLPLSSPSLSVPTSLKLKEFWRDKLQTAPPTPIAPLESVSVTSQRPRRDWMPSEKALQNLANLCHHTSQDAPQHPGEEQRGCVCVYKPPTVFLSGPKQETTPVDVSFSKVDRIPEPLADKPLEILPPKTLWEAQLCPWWPGYKEAMSVEWEGHIERKTWVEVPLSTVPKTKNILRAKWVFADKRDEKGHILKFKARLVAMGCTQREGEDFKETFAGVVVGKSFRSLLSILALDPSYEMEHWDVKMAFTTAPLEDEIYLFPPDGYSEEKKGVALKLLKSLYGLRQSARNFECFMRETLVISSFFALPSDPCVYLSRFDERAWCVACTHVDDIFCLFNREGRRSRDKLFATLGSRVDVENLGAVSWALKTHVLRDRVAGIIKISQEAYTLALLKKRGFEPAPSGQSNVVPTFDKDKLSSKEEDKYPLREMSDYQSDIGSLWWLAQISRPDIYYALHRASKMVKEPSKLLTARLHQIFLYLSHTVRLGLVYTFPSSLQSLQSSAPLSGYADAAFATEGESLSSRLYLLFFRKHSLMVE